MNNEKYKINNNNGIQYCACFLCSYLTILLFTGKSSIFIQDCVGKGSQT